MNEDELIVERSFYIFLLQNYVYGRLINFEYQWKIMGLPPEFAIEELDKIADSARGDLSYAGISDKDIDKYIHDWFDHYYRVFEFERELDDYEQP